MDQRKKELKEQYKLNRPDMGILAVTCLANGKRLLLSTPNLKGMENRIRFQLGMGSFPNRELQRDWLEYGEENFKIEVLDILPYSTDESKTDYRDDLEELRAMWVEKLRQEQVMLY